MSSTFDDLSEIGSNWFKHYGVKGMKWGVRKNKVTVKDSNSGGSGGSVEEKTAEEVAKEILDNLPRMQKLYGKNLDDSVYTVVVNKNNMTASEAEKLSKLLKKKDKRFTVSFVPEVPESKKNVKHSDMSDDFIAHYGIKGMKWGVRKNRKGMVKARATMGFRDRKDVSWVSDLSAQSPSYQNAYHQTHRKAASKIRASIRAINKNAKYKGQDFRKNSPLRTEYYKEISKAITTQLNASAAINAVSPGKRFEMRFNMDINEQANASVTIRNRDRSTGRKDTIELGKEALRSLREDSKKSRVRHSDEDGWDSEDLTIPVDLITNDQGYIEDIEFPETDADISHFDQIQEIGSDWLEHHGIKGMKWGVRKDRRGRGRVTVKDSDSKSGSNSSSGSDGSNQNSRRTQRALKRAGKTKVSEIKRDNSLKSNPKNRRMTDTELRRAIERMDLERRYAQAMGSDRKSGKQVVADILKDSGKQIAKQVIVNVGSDYIGRAARINLNKVVPPQYAVAVKNIVDSELNKKK